MDDNEFLLPSTLSSISFTCFHFVTLPRSFSCNTLLLYFALFLECGGYSTGGGGAHSCHEMRERE